MARYEWFDELTTNGSLPVKLYQYRMIRLLMGRRSARMGHAESDLFLL
jgi:hypothetical protein